MLTRIRIRWVRTVDEYRGVGVQSTLATHQGTVAIHQGTVAIHQGTVAIHQGTIAIHQGTVAIHQGTVAIHQGTAAIHQGTAAIHQDTVAIHQGTVAIQEGTKLFLKRSVLALGTGRVLGFSSHNGRLYCQGSSDAAYGEGFSTWYGRLCTALIACRTGVAVQTSLSHWASVIWCQHLAR